MSGLASARPLISLMSFGTAYCFLYQQQRLLKRALIPAAATTAGNPDRREPAGRQLDHPPPFNATGLAGAAELPVVHTFP